MYPSNRKGKKYGSANFHRQLIYETSKFFHICFISSVSSLEELIRVQKSSLGHVVQSWTILKTNKGHNSVKIKKKRHNNIFSTEKKYGSATFSYEISYPSKHMFLYSLTHQKRNEQTNGWKNGYPHNFEVWGIITHII